MEPLQDRGQRGWGQGQTTALEVAWEPGAWRSLRLDQHRRLYLLLPQTDLPTGHLASRSLSMDPRQLLSPLPPGTRWLQSAPASRGALIPQLWTLPALCFYLALPGSSPLRLLCSLTEDTRWTWGAWEVIIQGSHFSTQQTCR